MIESRQPRESRQKWKRWSSWAHQLKPELSLINIMRTITILLYTIKFNANTGVYWISLWLHNKRKNPRYGISRSEIENIRVDKIITWLSSVDFEWPIAYEKAIHKMGTAFSHNWPQMQIYPLLMLQGSLWHCLTASRFLDINEIWSHHNTPETKQKSKQWVSPVVLAPKKTQEGLSANKFMATVF